MEPTTTTHSDLVLHRHASFGIFSGFMNMYLHELNQWLKPRKVLPVLISWILLVNGTLYVLYQFFIRFQTSSATAENVLNSFVSTFSVAAGAFAIILGMAGPMGATMIMQNIIIDEKKTGTVGWLLSKPISRLSFILAKLSANSTIIAVGIIGIPSFLAYFQFWAFFQHPLNLFTYLAAISVIGLNIFFYATLTLMMGTLFMRRSLVNAIPFILIFFFSIFLYYIPDSVYFMPWGLVIPSTGNGLTLSIATSIFSDGRITNYWPIIWTPIWCVVFVSVAIWKFSREEL